MSVLGSAKAKETRRRKAMALLEEGLSQAAVARKLHVSEAAVSQWRKKYKAQGEAGLRTTQHDRRHPKLSWEHRAELLTLLAQGPQAHGFASPLWSLPRLGQLIAKRWGVQYSEAHLSKLLRQLGWSRQRPARRSKQRNEAAIAVWRAKTWPALQKKRGGKSERSSRSTRPGPIWNRPCGKPGLPGARRRRCPPGDVRRKSPPWAR